MQRLNHHHLYIFWVFAKTESVTQAARQLAIAQSAVTAQLRQLEEALGLVLIDRTRPRYPEVTDAGKRVLAYADSIFETSRELINWATRGDLPKERLLRVGALSGLSRNLQYEFLAPLVRARDAKLQVTTGDQEKLVELLRRHELDVILSSHNVKAEKGGHFFSHVLTSSPVVFVCQKKLPRRDLRDHAIEKSLYIPGAGFEARPELDAFLREHDLTSTIHGEVDDVALLRILALRSGAVVALPEMGIQTDLKSGAVQLVARAPDITQKFYAITRSRRVVQTDVEQLIRALRERR